MFMKRDLSFFDGFFLMFLSFFSATFHGIIQDSDQNNRYEIDSAQSEKIRLSSQYSDDQRLKNKKIEAE